MSVTEHLMRLGGWNVTLRPDTPKSLRSQIDLFDHVVITAVPVSPLVSMSDANMLASSIYTGVITKKDEFALSGFSPLWWLGTDDGVGPFPTGGGGSAFAVLAVQIIDLAHSPDITWITNGTQSISAILSAIGPMNDIAPGTVNTSGLFGVNANGPVTTMRELLDYICGRAGAEYRMRPNFTYDVASAANLFVTTPTTVITRKDGGPDGSRRGIRGPNLSIGSSGESITTKVWVYPADMLSTGVADAGTPPKAPSNSNAAFVRRTKSTDNGATNLDAVAGTLINLYSGQIDKITLDSQEYAITRFVTPGDTVYVYDPQVGLFDTANQIVYRGETITPIKVRLRSVTWPIEGGMGFYGRLTGSTVTYVDLTPWFVPETGNDAFDYGSDEQTTPAGFREGQGMVQGQPA